MTNPSKIIIEDVKRARKTNEQLTEKQVFELKTILKKASKELKESLYEFEDIAPLSSGKAFRMAQIQVLKNNIDTIIRDLDEGVSLITNNQTEEAFISGIHDGVSEFKKVKIPGYESLKNSEIKDLTAVIFAGIDKDALEFLIRYRLELMGDVSDQLKREIKNRITSAIATGKPTPELVREIGKIIDNPESFRRAGKTVFKTAQQRLMAICRTEINRAHIIGRLGFYEKAGVKKVRWLAALDNRTCSECSYKHGMTYDLHNFNGPPKHTNCRCSISYVM